MVYPTGLNVGPHFATLSRGNRTPSILPPAHGILEEEERRCGDFSRYLLHPNAAGNGVSDVYRNTFWLIYIAEHLQAAETRWAMLLDDDDVSQLLPLTEKDFYNGVGFFLGSSPLPFMTCPMAF